MNETKELEAPVHGRGISPLFIRRPITTTLVMVGFVLFGFIGYHALPVSDLPAVDYPTISVSASLPWRQSGNDGFFRRDSTRAPVFRHCGHRFNQFH
jgi:hypothetical protein